MLRKSPASNVWAAIFIKANFSLELFKSLDRPVNIYVRKQHLLLVLKQTKYTIKK